MPRINETEDGKYEVNGLIFHNTHMDKIEAVDNPLGGLTYIKKKTDLAERFRRFFMDYKYPKMEEHNKDLTYDEERKLSTDFLLSLDFVSKEVSRWPYYSWTHNLKVADLKDLFIQTFENDLTFQSAFNNRRTSMEKLIEHVELGIGKGNYLSLASTCEGYRNYEYIPEECKINSFEAMDYAKEWLRIFEPAIEEISTLQSVLNVPYQLSANLNGIPADQLRDIDLYSLTEFRYQDFLTYLMDFKNRFGRQNDYTIIVLGMEHGASGSARRL